LQEFIPGQRWINNVEAQLGLGTVLKTDHRTVTLFFPVANETRTFAKQSASLTRVVFGVGDTIHSREGRPLTVQTVDEEAGLLTYFGMGENNVDVSLFEGELDDFIQLNRPIERLITGQIDPDKWLELRYQTLLQVNRLAHSDLRGLTGCRTSLIPHQLYIAHEVANRYAPRVLLADEVGLGKTIEAGLILHQQLLTERAKRVLVVVPESLVHQWFIEMARRFNLHFSIFDEPRCQAIAESEEQDNPFHTEQLVLCHLKFFIDHPDRFQQASEGEWDLMVVDEAHHLQWSPQHTSPEYEIVAKLALESRGLLLLTATPEQLGKAGHFARLRLLDADRFPDYDAFVEEEDDYEPIALVIEALLSHQPLNDRDHQILMDTIKEGDNQPLLDILRSTEIDHPENRAAGHELVEHLLDRHGTGRVLFRNTRSAVKGFPARRVSAYPLPLPEGYKECLAAFGSVGVSEPQLLLSPELLYQATEVPSPIDWIRIDPRIDWLGRQLSQLKPDKVLVITASAQTALDIAEALKSRTGQHAAVFHERLSIIDRDRMAAFFADNENGSQVLICSEIGSEGRNFQFAHHLILFDLPLNPDLLEQRIGRLDRIGQTKTIDIRVPYLEESAQQILFHWYHDGLTAFEHTCPAGHAVYVRVRRQLIEALHRRDINMSELNDRTLALHKELTEAMQKGRDRLLEYNSCRPHIANRLKERAAAEDKDSILPEYMEAVFDSFGVDTEIHSENCIVIRPGSYMDTPFSGLQDEGMTITFDRKTALANEDVQFLTWDHPMVTAAMDRVQSSELGNTAVTAIEYPRVAPGTVLLECLYIIEPAAISNLHINRYLPPTVVRTVMDEHGGIHDKDLSHIFIKDNLIVIDKETAGKIILAKQQDLKQLISCSEERANTLAFGILATAHQTTTELLSKEIYRLKALKQVNPNVRNEEIDFFARQLEVVTEVIESTQVRLDALRVIVVTD